MAKSQKVAEGALPAYDFHIPGAIDDALAFIGKELALNTVTHYLVAVTIAVVGVLFIWTVKGFISNRAQKWLSGVDKTRVDKEMVEEVGVSLVPLLYLFPLYFALETLRFSSAMHSALSFLLLVLFTTRTVRFLSALASFVTDAHLRRHSESLNSAVGRALAPIIRVLFWTLGLTIILDNMGFQISSLLAGLGIMGVAVGLAGQTILADFFGYLVILMDRPFNIGDYIALNNGNAGTVESIGLKTTRLRAPSGEVIICPNGEITKQAVINSRLIYRRTATFSFGVAYETPSAVVRAIPGMVREIAKNLRNTEIVRVYLTALGDSSLNFEVVFSVSGRILDDQLGARQELFLGLLERFEKEKIVLAYPTRTLYIAGSTSGNLSPAS